MPAFQGVDTNSIEPTPALPEDELRLDREVRRLIQMHRRQWRVIELAAGVSHSWMSKFARGKIQNPGYATLKRLHMLLSERPAAATVAPPLPLAQPPLPALLQVPPVPSPPALPISESL